MWQKFLHRALMAFFIIFLPIANLGATGSYKQAGGVFVAIAVAMLLGWLERDNTIAGACDTEKNNLRDMTETDFDEAHGP